MRPLRTVLSSKSLLAISGAALTIAGLLLALALIPSPSRPDRAVVSGATGSTEASQGTTNTGSSGPGPVSQGQSTSANPGDYYSPIQTTGSPMTAADARSRVDSDPSVHNPTATYVKEATWQDYLEAKQISSPPVAGLGPTNKVLIAVAVGDIQYSTVRGTGQFSWIMQVFDQATSSYLGFTLGTGPLPAWYENWPDAS